MISFRQLLFAWKWLIISTIEGILIFTPVWILLAIIVLVALLTSCRPRSTDHVACPNHEARIAVLEQRMNAQTITVSWRQHGDTLWVWDKVIIEAKP